MIINALDGAQSDTHILQTIIQEEFKLSTKILQEKLILKTINFSSKVRDIHKIERNYSINIRVYRYENKEKYLTYMSKRCFEGKHVD